MPEVTMEYSRIKLNFTLVLAFAMAAAVQQASAQDSPADYLNPHNAARADVGVEPVTWDDTVAAYARSYAEKRRGDCVLVHSGGPYGENIYGGRVGPGGDNFFAADAVKAFVDEKQYYDHATNSCAADKVCGHYTQVVWRKTTTIGCARVVCDGNDGIFIICSYNPRGNFNGESPY